MAHYWIFKTDNKSGRTISICNGSHDTEAECQCHWRAYSYGLCDGFQECLGEVRGSFQLGEHELSLRIINGEKDVEYFMLLNDEGKNFHYELCSRI